MDSLALAYAALDRHADALELQEATLAASKRLLPPDHRDTLHSMNNLARTYFALGRHSDALKLFEETLAGRNRANTPAHPDTLFAMHELAKCYSALDRHEDALKQFEAELAARKQSPSPDHPRTLLSMCGVAGSQIELNRGAVAIPLIDECVARAAGKGVDPNLIPRAMNLRLRHFQKVSDPAGCRATAEMWERLNRPDADSLYAAARMRAAAAGVYAKAEQPAEAAADADRAMAWLTQAVAAGYKDRLHMGWDKDLAHLRPRADFRAMLASLPPTREAAPWPVSVKSLATPGAGR